jgi:hypothetical protein
MRWDNAGDIYKVALFNIRVTQRKLKGLQLVFMPPDAFREKNSFWYH